MARAHINDIEIEYEVDGSGPPMLLIHGGLIADAMRPLMTQPALQPFRRIRYHRRGFGGSTRPAETRPTWMGVQIADAIGLLDHLAVDSAHVVGHSAGAGIALELAARHPARVTSLVVLEPPLLRAPSAPLFVSAIEPCAHRYAHGDPEGAVLAFMTLVGDRDWRGALERNVPGGIDQAVKAAATHYETELPAFRDWDFGPEQAATISCPVLFMLGTDTSPFFVEGRDLLHDWIAGCHDTAIAGTSHLLQMEQPRPVAEAVAAFCT